jgi:hypothetical protein
MAANESGLTAEQVTKLVNDMRLLSDRVQVLEAWKKRVDDQADAASLAAGLVKSAGYLPRE